MREKGGCIWTCLSRHGAWRKAMCLNPLAVLRLVRSFMVDVHESPVDSRQILELVLQGLGAIAEIETSSARGP
jgi:hypothetical protein